MTIFQALTWANDILKTVLSPVQSPKIDAQALLAFVVDKGTAYLFAHGENVLTAAQEAQFKNFVERRARHEPVAYILQKKGFYGRTFSVTHDVLIPRPESEVLVDAAKKLITDRTLVVDVGTGSGAIGVTLACETGRPVVAIDESTAALAVARQNAAILGATHVMLLEGNLLSPLLAESNGESLGDHLIVVANLPYLSTRQYDTLDADVKHYEPQRALVSGVDGLDHYDALFGQLALRRAAFPRFLDVVIEIDPSQTLSAPARICKHFPLAKTTVIADHAHKPRVVHAAL